MAQARTKAARGKQSTRAKTSKKSTTAEQANGSMLEDFFMDALKDIYWAEKALTKALPKMSRSATSKELKKAFDQHLEVTKKHVGRLEKVFQQMGKKAQAKKCEAMSGLIEESESVMSETKDDTFTRDAALIISAQKAEHYEIAAYGGLIQLAKTMNKKGIANTLGATLGEEKRADEVLTGIAEKSVNTEAAREEKSPTVKDSFMTIFSS
ncbi:MAG TPA: ferritin-like domain-containing protein [Chryseosolibacter sp.]|nr:ferritin-like domain-containing protein [Chryseosolibacter sp.]